MKIFLSKLKFQNLSLAICKSIKVFFILFILLVSSPSVGNASTSSLAEDNAITRVLCNVYKLVTGKAGKTFAAFAVISAGIGFFTGKLQWGLLIALTLGIAAIFGSQTIVSAITGERTVLCEAGTATVAKGATGSATGSASTGKTSLDKVLDKLGDVVQGLTDGGADLLNTAVSSVRDLGGEVVWSILDSIF